MSALGGGHERRWAVGDPGRLAVLALLPLVARRDDVLNFVFLILLSITLAQSWNIVAGYAGQVNLGHAAFFGLGALVARTLWIRRHADPARHGGRRRGGHRVRAGDRRAAFRLRGAYFAIGTLALGEILRTTVGNVLPEISTLPAASIAGYRLTHRYYLALALAAVSVLAVAVLARLADRDSACRRSARTRRRPRPPAWAHCG